MKPTASRSVAIASARPFGSGMYGRATSDGYQKSSFSASPDKPGGGDLVLGLLDVVGRQVEGLPELGRRRHPVVGRLGQTGVERVDVRLLVDGVRDRGPDVQVVERLVGLVHLEPAVVARLTTVDDLVVRVRLQARDVVREDRLGEVDAAVALEGVQLRGLVRERLEDDRVEVGGLVLVPVVGVLRDRDVVVRHPLGELERTRADHAGALALGVLALARIGIVGVARLEGRRALDPELRQRRLRDQEVRLRLC